MNQQTFLKNIDFFIDKQKLKISNTYVSNLKFSKFLQERLKSSNISLVKRTVERRKKLKKSVKRYLRFKARFSSLIIYKKLLQRKIKNKIVIRVTGNNFFCTFIKLKKNKVNKIKLAKSAKQLHFKTSKKKISFNLPLVLLKFKNLLISKKMLFTKKMLKKSAKRRINFLPKNIILKIIAKKRIRRKIIGFFQTFRYKIRGRHISKKRKFRIFFIDPKKCFNGCRAVKARRKKRLRFRIFK